ncbi:MAG: alpha/beta hydrolase-fold protein, partial [Actinomycetota bacterium]|nr:alpha/beta hydrolase-fold protein [Actinomycetota bacterium]
WWNEGERNNPGWETWIRDELLPRVQRRFSIRPERRYHAVAGFSMGGYGTWLTASMLPGYFGTAVPLSAFASIREASSVTLFKTASGGTPFETVYGPADGFYAEGHDPTALGSNLAHTRLDVRTGDGRPDPSIRPENDPSHPGYAAEQDALSLILESGLKLQNDKAVEAVRTAGSTTVDYTVHKGSHDWEFWRPDLKASIRKGLFRPVPELPKRWTYRTAATSGQAWDIHFEFSPPPTAMTNFERNGRNLKVNGDGEMTISDGNGCRFTGELPFTRTLPARPCRNLKMSVRGRLKHNRTSRLTVTVKGLDAARVTSPVDAARVRIGGRSALTDARGRAVVKIRAARRGKVKVTAIKAGFRKAVKTVRVRSVR